MHKCPFGEDKYNERVWRQEKNSPTKYKPILMIVNKATKIKIGI